MLGGDFNARLNMDLREDKGWSYGVGGNESVMLHAVPYLVSAPVQADRTGDSLAELNAQIGDFLTNKGVTPEERERVVDQEHQPAARPVRDLGRGAGRDDEHRHARQARQLLRDAGAANIAR